MCLFLPFFSFLAAIFFAKKKCFPKVVSPNFPFNAKYNSSHILHIYPQHLISMKIRFHISSIYVEKDCVPNASAFISMLWTLWKAQKMYIKCMKIGTFNVHLVRYPIEKWFMCYLWHWFLDIFSFHNKRNYGRNV